MEVNTEEDFEEEGYGESDSHIGDNFDKTDEGVR